MPNFYVENAKCRFINLLNLCNSPIEGLNISSTLFQAHKINDSSDMDKSQTTLLRKQNKLKQEETGTKMKSPKIGNNVRVTVQPLRPQVRRWGEATVTKQMNGRSYEVQTENGH